MLRVYFIVINCISFLFYGFDKLKSKFNGFRVPEKILLNLSIFGGVYGSVFAMLLFHHKTKKKLFKKVNTVMFIIYTLLIYYIWRYL